MVKTVTFGSAISLTVTNLEGNSIATSLSGIYEISRKLYTTILFIKIDFTPAGHLQLDLIKIKRFYLNKI